jgi:glycosyltransferase involved in cell wall biosynthesis
MAIRILTQVNFSAGYNPEGDSGLYFTKGVIRGLLSKSNQYHFYVLVPKQNYEMWERCLGEDRVTLLPIEMVPRTKGGEFQFNPDEIYDITKLRHYEIDFLFLNQPEAASAYNHFFNTLLFHDIPIILYVHWFDIRGISSKKNSETSGILSSLTGMLVSDIVACNSQLAKNQIIQSSREWFNEKTISKLNNKIRVIPPGFDDEEINNKHKRHNSNGKITRIVVNHRLLNYTGVRGLLTDTFPKLWEIRQDFLVTFTNPSKVRISKKYRNKPWLIMGEYSRTEYIDVLLNSDIVVSPHKATYWSISTLEAIYANCVPLMNTESFFPELMCPILDKLNPNEKNNILENWFFSGNDLIDKLCDLMDNIDSQKEMIIKTSNLLQEHYSWKTITNEWHNMIMSLDSTLHKISYTNPSYLKIKRMIEEKGSISKRNILKNLKWGPQSSRLSWSAFRRRLRSEYIDEPNNAVVRYKK